MELPLWIADPAMAAADEVSVERALDGRPSVPAARRDRARRARAKRETTEARPHARARGRAPRGVAWPRVRTTPGTPLSQKLGAKPGAGVVVFFTTTREELERRFEALKATLDPADGLWIAWPKKAAKIEGDLTFEAVQEIGLAHGLVDNKSCSIDERWQALRFVYRLTDRP